MAVVAFGSRLGRGETEVFRGFVVSRESAAAVGGCWTAVGRGQC